MSFRPGFHPMGAMGNPFGFPQPQGIFFNPMLAQRFQQQMPPTMPPARTVVNARVFVGNISEKCTNEFIQRMLQECGNILSWKRIQGSNGRFQAFGFCDFETPDGTLRALRILNDFQVGEKKLVVKAEDKVLKDLRMWALERRREEGKPELMLKEGELPADQEDKDRDEEIRCKILNWIETDHPELLIVTEDGELSDKEKEVKKKDSKRKDDRKDDRDRRRRSRSRSTSRSKRRRGRSRSQKRKRRSASSSSRSSSGSSYTSDSSRSRSRSVTPRHKKSRRSRSRDSSDSEAEERRALKRHLKQKERNYQNHLRKWEDRERDKARYYEKMERKEKERKQNICKEAKKLRHFLEDYDDEKDDARYYRSSHLFQRKRDFEREREADLKDRLREQAEINELKKQIMQQNAEAAAAEALEMAKKKHNDEEEAAMRRLRGDSGSPNPHQPLGQGEEESSSSSSDEGEVELEAPPSPSTNSIKPHESYAINPPETYTKVDNSQTHSAFGFTSATVQPANWTTEITANGHHPESNGTPTLSAPFVRPVVRPNLSSRLENVFGVDDEEDVDALKTRKRLVPFEITAEDRRQTLTDGERRRMIKQLIDRIPKQKNEIIAFELDWSHVDEELVSGKVRSFVTKKIKEYIGEEDQSLADFICEKVLKKTDAESIQNDIKMILDEDAEVFIVKLWRLLIFESESRRLGIHRESNTSQS